MANCFLIDSPHVVCQTFKLKLFLRQVLMVWTFHLRSGGDISFMTAPLPASDCFWVLPLGDGGVLGWGRWVMDWVSSCSASASPGASSHATISIFTALWIWLECWTCSCCHFKPKCNHSHAQSCADPSQRWLLSDRDTYIFTLYWRAISPSVGLI